MDAYRHSVELGAKAIEVSVSATSDGKLVCHHDTSLERLTGHNIEIADINYAALSKLRNDASQWLGPAAKPQPIPLLRDVLDAFASTHVIFIEDKQGTNTSALLTMMDSYKSSRQHLIWKQWAGAGQYAAAKARGYKIWGYFTPDLEPRFAELATRYNYLGVYTTFTDAQISKVVSLGKPVIAWEIHYRSVRDRMTLLGVAGMMCSNLPYVTKRKAIARRDGFGSGLRAAGDLPWTTAEGYDVQPEINAAAATIQIDHPDYQSYLMGSLSPIASDSYSFSTELRWPTALPTAGQSAGIAFGLSDDSPYRYQIPSATSGFHLLLTENGSLELYSRQAGTAIGTMLASVATAAPSPGAWVRLRVDVSRSGITARRLDGRGWKTVARGANPSAGYVWLCKNYASGPAVQFRSVVVG